MKRPAAALALLLCASPAAAATDDEPVSTLQPAGPEADIVERLGQRVDPEIAFTDASGRAVKLGDYLSDGKPLLVVLAYYRCPMLCGLVLHGVVDGLKALGWTPGERYRVITVSFDPRDRPAAAREKQANALSALGRAGDPSAWPFLVGTEDASRSLADQLGFQYAYDERTDQYAHPAAIFALSPDGRISRYLYGVRFPARDLRLALTEAGQGKTSTLADRVLLTCYRYDPATRAYGPAISALVKIGGVLILVVVTATLALLWRRELRARRERR